MDDAKVWQALAELSGRVDVLEGFVQHATSAITANDDATVHGDSDEDSDESSDDEDSQEDFHSGRSLLDGLEALARRPSNGAAVSDNDYQLLGGFEELDRPLRDRAQLAEDAPGGNAPESSLSMYTQPEGTNKDKSGQTKANASWTMRQHKVLHLLCTRFAYTMREKTMIFNAIFKTETPKGRTQAALSTQWLKPTWVKKAYGWGDALKTPETKDEIKDHISIMTEIDEHAAKLGLALSRKDW